jgi:hypothetical protein
MTNLAQNVSDGTDGTDGTRKVNEKRVEPVIAVRARCRSLDGRVVVDRYPPAQAGSYAKTEDKILFSEASATSSNYR